MPSSDTLTAGYRITSPALAFVHVLLYITRFTTMRVSTASGCAGCWLLFMATCLTGLVSGFTPISMQQRQTAIDTLSLKRSIAGDLKELTLAKQEQQFNGVRVHGRVLLDGDAQPVTAVTDTAAQLRDITMRLYSEPARTAWTTPVTASMPMIEKKRQTGSGGGAAVLERPAPLIQPGTAEDQPSPADKFKVMLFNDNGNTREYVARSLVQVIGMTESDAYDIMTMAHKNGMALVGIWNLERAEAYSDQLKTRGLVSEIFPVE